jgi:NADH-quinone oxidoreductase subunit G
LNKTTDNVILVIDGIAVEVPVGTMIVEAAKKLGIDIPTFCYDERLRSVGACRMCLVEVEKIPKLVASCATPVAQNMIVRTKSDKVLKARKGVLEFLLINHPLDCPTCDKGGECPLQNLTYDHGPGATRYKEDKIRFIKDINSRYDDKPLGPEVLLCSNRCIMCFKCIRIVRELAGEADLGVFDRSAFARIDVLDEVAFADEYSGNTVEYCPVGALTSRSFRYKIRNWLLKKTPSVCNLCSVGCNISIEWSGDNVYRHMARPNAAVEDGWLCDRGRYGFDIVGSPDRITRPHIRRDMNLVASSWDEAAILVTKHLSKIISGNHGTEVAVIGSPMLSNEEAYAIRRFFDDVVKTSDIDFQTDATQPLEPELIDMIGLQGSIVDLENDELFLFVGYDPAVEHPVASLKIRKAISQNGAKAIFIGSYNKRLGNFPVTNIRIPYGAEAHALEYMISQLTSANIDADSDLNVGRLAEIAQLIENSKNVHIMSGQGFFNHPDRNGLLSALLKLKNAANAKLSILPSKGNFIGVSHFGLYGDLEHSFHKILTRIESGEIKTLFVFGANPVDEYPDRKYVQDALKKLEFLVVAAPFMNATASLASIVFPQAMLPDYGGTFVNIESRIQQFHPMSERRNSDIKAAWGILGEFSDILGLGTVWYQDSQIRQDMAKQLKGLEAIASIPGEGLLFRFKDDNEMTPQDIVIRPYQKAPEEYPYILQYAQSVHHQGWLTEKSQNLMRISGSPMVLMNPHDASKEGVSDGETIHVGAQSITLEFIVKVTADVNRGELLLLNSFASNPVNKLMDRNTLTTFVLVRKS